MRAALRALALALLAAPAAAQQPAADPQAIAHLFPPLVQAMNAERTARGLPPLAENTALANAAGHHAQDMARRGYLAHASPDGRRPGDRIRAAGFDWCVAAENIAFAQADAAETVAAWMGSAGHRANILNPAATHTGAAIAVARGRPYWVAVFAAPC